MSDDAEPRENPIMRATLDRVALYERQVVRLGNHIPTVVVEAVARVKITHQVDQIIRVSVLYFTVFVDNGAGGGFQQGF